jgi:hypothetical protein
MRISDLDRCTLSVCALMVLAGCGGGSQLPLGAAADSRGSWMLPQAKHGDLLYVATGDNVYVVSYPRGELVGSLKVSGNNVCADKNGNVFVPTISYTILEYPHGSIYPSQTLQGGDIPLGCAVDPITDNLAVTQEGSGAGEVAIFPNEREPATWYRDPDIYTYGLCGYDDRGNLFVDGSGVEDYYLAELPEGSSTFTNYPLDSRFAGFGSIQWDGRHITFSNPTTDQLFRLKFGSNSFKVIGTTQINGWQNNYSGHWPYVQTWLQGTTFVAQSSSLAQLGLWPYPAGGNARKVLGPFKSGNVNVYGVAISVAPRH